MYANEQVQVALKREFHYVFSGDNYPGIPRINVHTIDTAPFDVSGVKFIPIQVLHYQLPVLGFRVNDFTYITDANFISDEEIEKIKGTKVLVLNALRRAKHISHFTLEEALELVKKINPEKAYFTHISHQLGLHDEVSKELPSNVELAYDGLQVIV